MSYYRPFRDGREFIMEVRKHSPNPTANVYAKKYLSGQTIIISAFHTTGVYIKNCGWISFEDLFDAYHFLDDIRCGIKVNKNDVRKGKKQGDMV